MKKIFTNIYKMLANHEEKSSPPDQNFASLNKFIDKIKECKGMKTTYYQTLSMRNQ